MGDKALVVLSGGQDSATCLAVAVDKYDEVHTISFNYGQRHSVELTCARILSGACGCKSHEEVAISSLQSLSPSSLLDSSLDVNSPHKLNSNLPSSFVPGRNYIFLGLAAIHAYRLGIHDIYTGVCQTDYSGYPDCREKTIKSIETSLELSMECPFNIITPLMYLTKAQTVELMKKMGKLHLYKYTNTCYLGERPPCGKCPACRLRAKGFLEAGVEDPLIHYYGGGHEKAS